VDSETEPTGTLRITTVPGFGQSRDFVDCIRDFGLKYPRSVVEMELTTRLVNLVEEGFDVGVRLHSGELPGSSSLMSRRLLKFGRAVYASSSYIKEMGCPKSLEDLSEHRIAAHSIVDIRGAHWNRVGQRLDNPTVLPSPRWLVNDSAALERFAQAGAGLALLSTIEAESLVQKGELVRVLPDYEQEGATASLVWPASRHLAPRVRAFIDHAVETLGTSKT